MLHPDPRAYRVALVADAIVNDGAVPYDLVALLDAADFGVIVLPPSDFEISTIGSIVEYVVDDLVDYRAKGYAVVVIGDSALPQFGVWSNHIDHEVARRNIDRFDAFDVRALDEPAFAAFLAAAVPSVSSSNTPH